MALTLSTYDKSASSELDTRVVGDLTLSPVIPPSQERVLRLLVRRWWVVAASGLAGIVVATIYVGRIPDSFTAYGIIAVQPQRFTIPELQGAVTGDHAADPLPEVLTEVQVLTSPRVVQQVIDQLHIDARSASDAPATTSHPEVSKFWTQAEPVLAKLNNWKGQLEDRTGLKLEPGGDPAASSVASPDAERQTILNDVEKRLAVSHDSRSLIIKIQYTSTNPKMAADVVNTLIDVYDGAREKDYRQINEAANKSLMGRIDDLRGQITTAENQIRTLRLRDDLPELSVGNVNEQQLSELITAANRTSSELAQTEAAAGRARSLARTGSTGDLAAVVTSQTISQLRGQETAASRALAEIQSRLGTNHPLVASARSNLQAIQSQIAAEINRTAASISSTAEVASQQDRKAQAALATARGNSHKMAGALLQIRQLEQDVAAKRRLYEALLMRAEQTQTDPTQQMVTGARVISRAMVPGLPIGPKRKLSIAFGTAGGLLLGGFLALTSGSAKRKFRDRNALAVAMGMPVLSKLPSLKSPLSAKAVEALRVLRSRMQQPVDSYKFLAVMFTAAGGGADAVTTSISYGRTAAMDGQRVLLVGGLLTQSSLARSLGIDLASYDDRVNGVFTKATPLAEAVTRDPKSMMDVVLIGKPPTEFLNTLYGSGFHGVIEQAKQHYDLVVICAPPPDLSETIALARSANVVLFVVGSSSVQVPLLQATVLDFPYQPRCYAAAVLTG